MFKNLDIFKISSAMAQHASQQQAVAARNIANADTPGYVAQRLPDFHSAYRPTDNLHMHKSSRVGHMHGSATRPTLHAAFNAKDETSPNGNGVSLETEMLKSVDAKRQHDRALAIYKSALNILRSTVRG